MKIGLQVWVVLLDFRYQTSRNKNTIFNYLSGLKFNVYIEYSFLLIM